MVSKEPKARLSKDRQSAVGRDGGGPFETHRLSVGVEVFCLREQMANDLDGTLRRLAEMGYDFVELAGYNGHSPEQLKAAADRAGLPVLGIHMHPTMRMYAGDPALTDDVALFAADLRRLGISEVVLASMLLPPHSARKTNESPIEFAIRVASAFTDDDWKRTASLLNERAASLRNEGFNLSYHNTNLEFTPLSGKTGWDLLMAETDPDLVGFEMDVGWVSAAGIDPIALISKYPGRVRMLHAKDVVATSVPNFAMHRDLAIIGQGRINWELLLPISRYMGVRHYIVDIEPPIEGDIFHVLSENLAQLKMVNLGVSQSP